MFPFHSSYCPHFHQEVIKNTFFPHLEGSDLCKSRPSSQKLSWILATMVANNLNTYNKLSTEQTCRGALRAPQIQHAHNSNNCLTLLLRPLCLPGLALPPQPPGLPITVSGPVITQVAKQRI